MNEEFEAHMEEAFTAWLEGPDTGIRFDIYACAPDEFPLLKVVAPSVVVLSAGGFCPFQAEGYVKGLPFYFRSEEGTANLRVAEDKADVHFRHLWSSSETLTEAEEGGMGYVQWYAFEEVLARMVRKLERSPFRYEFEGWDHAIDAHGKLIVNREKRYRRHSWGFTPVEAELAIYERNPWLEEKLGMTAEEMYHFELQREWTITNSDDRVWPEVDFTTL